MRYRKTQPNRRAVIENVNRVSLRPNRMPESVNGVSQVLIDVGKLFAVRRNGEGEAGDQTAPAILLLHGSRRRHTCSATSLPR
jgi:hypothetical protein